MIETRSDKQNTFVEMMNRDRQGHWIEHDVLVECAVPRGGVLAMKPLLIHSSLKAITTAPRCVLHIEYADSICLADDICLAAA